MELIYSEDDESFSFGSTIKGGMDLSSQRLWDRTSDLTMDSSIRPRHGHQGKWTTKIHHVYHNHNQEQFDFYSLSPIGNGAQDENEDEDENENEELEKELKKLEYCHVLDEIDDDILLMTKAAEKLSKRNAPCSYKPLLKEHQSGEPADSKGKEREQFRFDPSAPCACQMMTKNKDDDNPFGSNPLHSKPGTKAAVDYLFNESPTRKPSSENKKGTTTDFWSLVNRFQSSLPPAAVVDQHPTAICSLLGLSQLSQPSSSSSSYIELKRTTEYSYSPFKQCSLPTTTFGQGTTSVTCPGFTNNNNLTPLQSSTTCGPESTRSLFDTPTFQSLHDTYSKFWSGYGTTAAASAKTCATNCSSKMMQTRCRSGCQAMMEKSGKTCSSSSPSTHWSRFQQNTRHYYSHQDPSTMSLEPQTHNTSSSSHHHRRTMTHSTTSNNYRSLRTTSSSAFASPKKNDQETLVFYYYYYQRKQSTQSSKYQQVE